LWLMAPVDRPAARTQEGMPWRCGNPAAGARRYLALTGPPVTADPQAGGPALGGQDHFPSLLSEMPPSPRAAGDQDENRSHARDLNLDQIVAAVAGDREERDLITTVLGSR
jgi:hypothetical protein